MITRRKIVPVVVATVLGLLAVCPTAHASDFQTELVQARKLRNIIDRKEKADLLIRNVNIVDVYREAVYPGSLLIANGKIVAINPDAGMAREEFDGQGLYAVPGLIDGHFHVESQLVTPTALAEAMVPHGITSVFAECLDLVSAAGDDGLKAATVLFNRHEELPYRIYPFAPGKKVRFDIVRQMLDWDFILGLGEMNPSKVFNDNDEDLKKVAYARSRNKLISGHVSDVAPFQENLFPALGVMDDHDNWNIGEVESNLKIGLPSFLMYGLHGVDNIVPGLVNARIPSENVMMSTDNLAVEHMVRVGHLDVAIRESIARGLDPITAIKMASYNTAKHFKMEDKLGSLTPGRFADIILVDDLRSFTPRYVFQGGQLVAQDGKLLKNATIDYSSLVTKPTRGLDDFKPDDLKVKPIEVSADHSKAKVTVFNFFGFGPEGFSHDVWLPVRNGEIVPELNGEKLLNFAIIQRYANGQPRKVVNGFIRQFPLGRGAVAVGFSAPRANVITMGADLNDMYVALKEADKYMGGFVAADAGSVKQAVPMNIYGMMTDYSVSELIRRSDKLDEALDAMGHRKSGTAVNTLLEVFYLADRHGFLD